MIKSVDDRDVSRLDSYFELLPGCHIVKTQDRIEMRSNRTNSFPGERVFPLRMRAGFDYAVVVRFVATLGRGKNEPAGAYRVYSVERNASGTQTATIEEAGSVEDVKFCQAWTPAPS